MDLSKIHFASATPEETLRDRTKGTYILAFMREFQADMPLSEAESELSQDLQSFAPRISLVMGYRSGQISESEFSRHVRLDLIPHVEHLARMLLVAFADARDGDMEDITMICNTDGKCQCQILVDMISGYQAKYGEMPDPTLI